MAEQSQERVLFEGDGIKVTDKRAILGNKTYAITNITSVQKSKKNKGQLLPFILIILGIGLGLAALVNIKQGGACLAVGVVMVLIGGLLVSNAKDRYIVRLGSASGETDGLISPSEELIDTVVEAINQAIIGR
jgi:hypothetical protein